MTERPPQPLHLRLAGVTRLGLQRSRGPRDAFVFDPHRLALPCWALALEEAGSSEPALLVTLDRHFDLQAPADPAAIPSRAAGVRALDEHARWSLDAANRDHVLSAMEAGLVGDAIAIARSRPGAPPPPKRHLDRLGREHRILQAPAVGHLSQGFKERDASPQAAAALELLERAPAVLLDIDLDCFTTLCDADPTSVVPWPRALIREQLLPEGSAPFWDAVLSKALCLTFAREPFHTGGLTASARLFEEAAGIVFGELLGAEPP